MAKRQPVISNVPDTTPIKVAYVPQIKNSKNSNAYGVLLHVRTAIEQFQINSDMKGRYTKEYQHHYWAANARIAVDGQLLDISIPLVMFNYEQVVTGGDIKFDLEHVTAASKALEELAIAKFKELQETAIYKYISEELGLQEWQLVPLNTAHVHPGGKQQRFSGIDLRASVTYPGVVYPLSTGSNISSFSCIMAHIEGKAEIVHSEYRLFNQAENGDKVYAHGRCATIVRGYIPEPLPRVVQPEAVPQRMIDKIFGIMPAQPAEVVQKEAKDVPSYVLRDNLKDADGKEFLDGLQTEWDKSKFEPSTEFIKKENVKSPQITTYFGQGNQTKNTQGQQEFWDNDEKTHSSHRQKQGGRDAETGTTKGSVSVFDQKSLIVKEGLASWQELQAMVLKDVEDMYNMVLMLTGNGSNAQMDDENPFEPEVKRREGKDYGYSPEEIVKIRHLLLEEDYLTLGKLDDMSDENIAAYYNTFYEYPGE